jgi:hypothetical protein
MAGLLALVLCIGGIIDGYSSHKHLKAVIANMFLWEVLLFTIVFPYTIGSILGHLINNALATRIDKISTRLSRFLSKRPFYKMMNTYKEFKDH